MSTKLSIIVATINRHHHLNDCLESIYALPENVLANIEVIVVDQSKEVYRPSKQYPRLRILTCSSGASKARNTGAQASKGEYLLFFDDDALLLSLDISFYEDLVFLEWKERPITLKKFNWLSKKIFFLRKSGAPFFISRREDYNKVSGFDDSLGPGRPIYGSEDLDYLLRILRHAKKIRFNQVGLVSHSVLNSPDKVYMYSYSRAYVLLKNKEFIYLFILSIVYALSIFIPSRRKSAFGFFAGLLS